MNGTICDRFEIIMLYVVVACFQKALVQRCNSCPVATKCNDFIGKRCFEIESRCISILDEIEISNVHVLHKGALK